jgi:hypothetical protein
MPNGYGTLTLPQRVVQPGSPIISWRPWSPLTVATVTNNSEKKMSCNNAAAATAEVDLHRRSS